jgi:hypothetical protein
VGKRLTKRERERRAQISASLKRYHADKKKPQSERTKPRELRKRGLDARTLARTLRDYVLRDVGRFRDATKSSHWERRAPQQIARAEGDWDHDEGVPGMEVGYAVERADFMIPEGWRVSYRFLMAPIDEDGEEDAPRMWFSLGSRVSRESGLLVRRWIQEGLDSRRIEVWGIRVGVYGPRPKRRKPGASGRSTAKPKRGTSTSSPSRKPRTAKRTASTPTKKSKRGTKR